MSLWVYYHTVLSQKVMSPTPPARVSDSVLPADLAARTRIGNTAWCSCTKCAALPTAGADAEFRVRRGGGGGGASGVSGISAREVLKVRPHTKSGEGGGGWAVQFRSDIRKVGGNSLQVRYEGST